MTGTAARGWGREVSLMALFFGVLCTEPLPVGLLTR
jgi:hypothetical protein